MSLVKITTDNGELLWTPVILYFLILIVVILILGALWNYSITQELKGINKNLKGLQDVLHYNLKPNNFDKYYAQRGDIPPINYGRENTFDVKDMNEKK